jgi:cytochrome c
LGGVAVAGHGKGDLTARIGKTRSHVAGLHFGAILAAPPAPFLGEPPMRVALAALVALALVAPVAAPAMAQDDPKARRACAKATRPVAQALAEKAAAHLVAVGREQAFKDYGDPAKGFLDGDLYVFVFDFEGTLVASGGFPEHVGRRLIGHSPDSTRYVGGLLAVGREKGKGWYDYIWLNPCSRQRETKGSYVIKVGDLLVGVGAYVREGV